MFDLASTSWNIVPRLVASFLTVILIVVSCLAEQPVRETTHALLGDEALHVYVGSVSLPADGLWRIRDPESTSSIRELYLMPTPPSRLRQLGKRMYAALEERQIQRGRRQVEWGFEACRQYAQERMGLGPKSIEDLAVDGRWRHFSDQWDFPSSRIKELKDFVDDGEIKGPFVHLIPEVRFQFAEPKERPDGVETSVPTERSGNERVRRVVAKEDRLPLAFELRPFIDDGKHWVLYTDGACERVAIDPELITAQGVEIRPSISQDRVGINAEQPNLEYRIVLVASDPVTEMLSLTAHNQVLETDQVIQWDTRTEGGDVPYDDLRRTVTEARSFAWKPYLLAGSGGVLDVWDGATSENQSVENARPPLSMFSVLGGRAAIEETLQLQNLNVDGSEEEATIGVDSLTGVEVKSHPFQEMLGGQPGGSLEMARYVPPDRFFVYVGKPETISALLDTGAPFIAGMGTVLTGNCLQYNLETRYLARLGMTRDWVDAVLASGLTSEMAIFTPDLFFIDGTDLTVVAKLRQPGMLRQLLALLGASELESETVLELSTISGDSAYLALRGDLLFASTNRGELDQSLNLLEQRGEGSLGASAEFRYMLTKLEVNQDTRLYAYLSDPFVRRLVGPQVKIGQRRRVLAKAKMEVLTASAMLARLDGQHMPAAPAELVRSGHLPEGWQIEDLSIEPTGLVRSQHYGSLPEMRTLPEVPLNDVTPAEAEAYRLYVENYSRYWRRFFDPIAIRLDEVGRDQLELSTFILPLVDNSIYNGMRMMLADQVDGSTLAVPIVEPTPVLQFSVNLKEQAWQQIAGNFSDFFTRYSGASPAMLDDLGPSAARGDI